jgi:hypothetical protein
MNQAELELFLLNQVPLRTRALIPSTFKAAYAAAAGLMAETPMLSVPSAEDNYGRFISWAVDFGFQKLIESGQWPCDYRWRPFARPTGRYLEIRLTHSIITISQVSDPEKQPRDVVFRANMRLHNEPYLDLEEFAYENQVLGLPHILLVHGHHTLDFIHLGIPYGRHSAGYLYRTPNLLNMPHDMTAPQAQEENTDIEAVMSLREEIERWQRENGQ